MILYAYREIDDAGNPTGVHGFVIVETNKASDLFWNVDQFLNPNACEYARLTPQQRRGFNIIFTYSQFNNRKDGDGRVGYELSDEDEGSVIDDLNYSDAFSDYDMSELDWKPINFDMEEIYSV